MNGFGLLKTTCISVDLAKTHRTLVGRGSFLLNEAFGHVLLTATRRLEEDVTLLDRRSAETADPGSHDVMLLGMKPNRDPRRSHPFNQLDPDSFCADRTPALSELNEHFWQVVCIRQS